MEVWISSAMKYYIANGCNLFIEMGCASSTHLVYLHSMGTTLKKMNNKRYHEFYFLDLMLVLIAVRPRLRPWR